LLQVLDSPNRGNNPLQAENTAANLQIRSQSGFYIEGNAALAAKSSSGNGTEENPFVIENLQITEGIPVGGEEGSSCYSQFNPIFGIFINSTDKFFTIRNCSILLPYHPPWYNPWCMHLIYYYYYIGIQLLNVTNGKLCNITISIESGFQTGLSLDYSSNNTISNNTFIDFDRGITLFYSNHNKLIKNLIQNDDVGLDLVGSSHNTIINNTITNNRYPLLLIDSSNSNSISNNTFKFNYNRIEEIESQENSFQDNIFQDIPPLPVVSWFLPCLIAIGFLGTTLFLRKRRHSRAHREP
jgi:parallel beta-helix repeat protein